MMLSRLLLLVLAAAALTACAGDSNEDDVAPVTTYSSGPGAVVEVNGRKLWFECAGEGRPTVVLENGVGTDAASWLSVFGRFAELSRVCRYDRAGLGLTQQLGSPLGTTARTARDQVADLRGLLERARIGGPYVLVGHSWGGILVRLFAFEQQDDVAAVVLVDGSHPDSDRRFLAALPPQPADENAAVAALRLELRPLAITDNPERLDFGQSRAEARAAASLGQTPLVVVTAGRNFGGGAFPATTGRDLDAAWLEMQRQLAMLSTNSVHVVAEGSGHFVQLDGEGRPDIVVAAVRAALEAARNDGELRSCAAIFRMPSARCAAR
jgi:pimeloyl-ACP methyl ester carboxylesterase